jgi:hypothetical protein
LEKFQFFKKEVWYVGRNVLPEGITTGAEKLKAVWEWLTQKNKHEMRSFLGLCTYYRLFISGFAYTVTQLTKLTEGKQLQK